MPDPVRADDLTERERACLLAYVECWSYRCVAANLGIGELYARKLGMEIVRKTPGALCIGHAIHLRTRIAA